MRSSAIQGVQTDLRKQLAYPKVAQPKLAAYSAPSVLLVSSTHPARMTDSPAKRPGGSLLFVVASHQTRLDTRSKARRPIKVGIKGRGKSGTSQDSSPAGQCCWSAHLVQCELDEASSFTNPNVGPGTYASLRLKLDTWSSAVHGWQRRQKCSSPTRRLPSRRECVWPLTRFASWKWRSGLNRICHPDWVKFSVELNSAPKQNTRFSSSLQWLKLDTWSSAVHGWQRRQKCSSPTRRLPSRSWGPIRPESALGFEHPSGTNARRPSQKAGGVAYERWKRACWYDESAVTHSSCRMNMEFFCKKMSVAIRYFFKPAISWRRLLVPVLSSYFWLKCFVNIINFNSSFSFSYKEMSRLLERKRA